MTRQLDFGHCVKQIDALASSCRLILTPRYSATAGIAPVAFPDCRTGLSFLLRSATSSSGRMPS